MPNLESPLPPQVFLAKSFKPAIVTWNRLEGRPRRADFERSLRAEVRDACWMLSRQWQLGEFRGEDAGSAVKARVQVESRRIDRYMPEAGSAVPYDDETPLEVRVEREAVAPTLAARVQIGRHFRRLLGSAWAGVRDVYLSEFGIGAPAAGSEAEAQLESDVRARAYHAAVSGRVVDGADLLSAIGDGRHETFVLGLSIPEGQKDLLRVAATSLSAWYARLYSAPAGEPPAWRPSRLEYAFSCSAPADQAGETRLVLEAEEYPGGHLDWPAFDLEARPDDPTEEEGEPRQPAGSELLAPLSFIPAPIEYGGMPNVRWWQLEDRKTDFGQINAATTDLPLLMVAEFGLIYGNDWSLVPYDLPVGSLSDVKGVLVTDAFGVKTFVRRAGTRDDESWQHWNVYDLSWDSAKPAPYLLLAPSLGLRDEGRPIESVNLLRDEMANMVFGVETRIPGPVGLGVDGADAARALRYHLLQRAGGGAGTEEEEPETDAAIRYVAGTTVPENWIPFLPTHLPGEEAQIRLQRGRMAQVVPLAPSDTVEPRGEILRQGLDQHEPYFLYEEEVPRAGCRVQRAFQRTRWYDGRVFTWLGREKTVGRGEGEGGLRFDQIVPRSK